MRWRPAGGAERDVAPKAIEAGFGAIDDGGRLGRLTILNKVTVSVGVIQGGVKINVLPGHCRLEVDIRLPVGMTHAFLLRRGRARSSRATSRRG